jgi:glycosyltransferase A (GT-A) superfamily protein (DUF2064 family)
MSGAIAIFVKTPGRSPLKTRLAACIGETAAVGFYRAATAATAAVVQQFVDQRGASAYWAVAEADALDDACWAGLPRLAQGEGGLGERMGRVHATLVERHGGGLLIGADAPQLQASELARADAWLDAAAPRLVIGPARDGGFWLFGGNRALPLADWTAVRYSRADTAHDFRCAMDRHGAWMSVATLDDVDHGEDLPALLGALQQLPAPLPEQRQLIALLGATGLGNMAQRQAQPA